MFRTRAKYALGQVVRHKKHPFRGVVFDVDAKFSKTAVRPRISRSTTFWQRTTKATTWLTSPSKTSSQTTQVSRSSIRICQSFSAILTTVIIRYKFN